MRYIAVLYSVVFGCVAVWEWISCFSFGHAMEEHLLPGIILNIVTLPSSLLMDKILLLSPEVLNSKIAVLSIVTGFGFLQMALLWTLALRISKKHKE